MGFGPSFAFWMASLPGLNRGMCFDAMGRAGPEFHTATSTSSPFTLDGSHLIHYTIARA
jgi:hypothetical protein